MDNKKLNFWECMSFCIGQIVGSGVFVLTGIVIGLTGHGAPYGFVLAALIAVCQLVPMATLASSMPATGGKFCQCFDRMNQFFMTVDRQSAIISSLVHRSSDHTDHPDHS